MELETGAVVHQAFAFEQAPELLVIIGRVARAFSWRHMTTARGWRMSVAMTNCGDAGWLSDSSGYRYDTIDPQTQRHWPALPVAFADLADLAGRASRAAGFEHVVPDACLINRYAPGAWRPPVIPSGSTRTGLQ